VTVSLTDPQNALQGAYYRVSQGNWQLLTFQNNQASFPAQGTVEYEVAARCNASNPFSAGTLRFFKARTDQTRSLKLVCSVPNPPQTVPFTFTVQLPAQIGGVSIQNGDLVLVQDRQGQVSNLSATISMQLPPGQQDVLVAVFRVAGSNPPSIQPIGGKLVSVNVASGGSLTVNNQGYQSFTVRNITATTPSGFQGIGQVLFFKNTMKTFGLAGGLDKYGVLPNAGGKYLGFYQADGSGQSLRVFQDTNGQDWNVNLPTPWGSGQFTPSGRTYTLAYPNAQAYGLQLRGLARDANNGNPLQVEVFIYPTGQSTTYTLPDLTSQLGYAWATSGSVSYTAQAVVRGAADVAKLEELFGFSAPTESALQGLDFAAASLSDSYNLP